MEFLKGFISGILLALGFIGAATGFIFGILSGVSIGYQNSNCGHTQQSKTPPYNSYRDYWVGGEKNVNR